MEGSSGEFWSTGGTPDRPFVEEVVTALSDNLLGEEMLVGSRLKDVDYGCFYLIGYNNDSIPN